MYVHINILYYTILYKYCVYIYIYIYVSLPIAISAMTQARDQMSSDVVPRP